MAELKSNYEEESIENMATSFSVRLVELPNEWIVMLDENETYRVPKKSDKGNEEEYEKDLKEIKEQLFAWIKVHIDESTDDIREMLGLLP